MKGPKPINRSKIENVENRDRQLKDIQNFRKENPDLEILPSGLRKNRVKDRQNDENRPKRNLQNRNFLRSLSSRSWP